MGKAALRQITINPIGAFQPRKAELILGETALPADLKTVTGRAVIRLAQDCLLTANDTLEVRLG